MGETTDTQFDEACDELWDLLFGNDLLDGMSGSVPDRTLDLHLVDEQVPGLLHLLKTGLLNQARAQHPAGATSNGAA